MKPIRSVFFIFSCWLATVLPARAFAVSAPPESIVVPAYTYFVDTSRQLKAPDIALRLANGEFIRPNRKAMTFGYTDHHYWVAFTLRNDSSEALYLLPGHPLLEVQVYRILDNLRLVPEASVRERYAVTEVKLPAQMEAQFLALVTSPVALTVVSLHEVFASLAFLFESKAQEKGLNLEFQLEHPGLTVLDAFGATIQVASKTIQADPDASGTVFRILIQAAPPLPSVLT